MHLNTGAKRSRICIRKQIGNKIIDIVTDLIYNRNGGVICSTIPERSDLASRKAPLRTLLRLL